MSSISEMTREIEERGLYDKEPLTRKPLCKFCGLPFTRQQNGIESFGCGSSYMESCRPQWIRTMECYDIENGKLQERIKRLEDELSDAYSEIREHHSEVFGVFNYVVLQRAKEAKP